MVNSIGESLLLHYILKTVGNMYINKNILPSSEETKSLSRSSIMEKNTKMDLIALLDGKITEQHTVIKALLACKSPSTGEPISENTQHTQLHVQKTSLKNLLLIKHLLEDAMTEDDMKHFVSITTLSEERAQSRAIVHAGDSVMNLIMSNPKLTLEKIQKACEKAGLRITDDGAIVA